MKAIVCTQYGPPLDVLQLKEVDKPTPRDNQVLVKVYAASVNKKDLAPLRGAFMARLLGTGLLKPKRQLLGDDITGRVEAVGKDVKQFQPGDEVFGDAPGAFAEYACAREDLLVLKPTNVTFEEAAAVPVAAITALQGVRVGQIQHGQKVLVNGASGGVGTFVVQIAKSFGTEVTAVCSPQNVDIARSIGADHVIDYTQEDFTKSGQVYDLILAVNGYHPILGYRNALSPKGTCVVVGGELPQIFQALVLGPLISKSGGKKIAFMGIAKLNHMDLVLLKELLEAGKVKSVVDRRYPLSKTAEAIQYLEEGHARGKVVIAVEHNQT
jgi:NADPH:quinone reductase-like Zn-dependent oxidoreductase